MATPTVKQVSLVPADEPMALTKPQAGGELVSLFERFASNPNISVENLERLMALYERTEAKRAEAEFNAAMSRAQAQMRPVAADSWNPQTKSKYASYEALDLALRPIYTEHGFGLSFDTAESQKTDFVVVLCYVTHAAGHSRTYRIEMPADGKGAKGGDVMTKTHATGSAMSYGMRYLLKLIFNIAVGEEDDDGNRAGTKAEPKPEAPSGYEDWQVNMEACADEGWPKLSQAFGKSSQDYRNRATRVDKAWWDGLKKKAEQVKA